MLNIVDPERAAAHSGEQGFTLVELLVVMLAGMIILIALFTILDVTLRQTSRTFTRVDASQRARTTIASIENELHSACVANQVTPIQTGSSNSSMIFVTQYGNAATPTPVEHQITYSSSANTLTDTMYASTGGTAPNWTFSATPTSNSPVTLLDNVSQSSSTPVFQYFAYQEPTNSVGTVYTDSGGNPYMMLLDGTSSVPGTGTIPTADPLTTPLSSTDASNAAEVLITLVVGPKAGATGENSNVPDANATITNSVVLRLTPVANHVGTGNTFVPCQ